MMRRINGRKLGSWSLRLDAGYCAAVGVFLALSADIVTQESSFSPSLIMAAGVAVLLWAAGIWWMFSRLPLRLALRLVMTVNVLAAIAVGFASAAAATALMVAAVLIVAIEVALFATSQAMALRALPVHD